MRGPTRNITRILLHAIGYIFRFHDEPFTLYEVELSTEHVVTSAKLQKDKLYYAADNARSIQ